MVLHVRNLTKSYGTGADRAEVLTGVTFDVASGEAVALEGESGSGKSTLLHIIATLEQSTNGEVLIDGQSISGLSDRQSAVLRREKVGIIFQQFNLIPSLTARANIAFHARLSGAFDQEWADRLARDLGLSAHLDKYPEALSGGQQQRVAIARTLAARPKLILADEPTGNLDEDTADRVLQLMLDAAAEAEAAVLMVTHSPRLAGAMGRRLVLSHGCVTAFSTAATRNGLP